MARGLQKVGLHTHALLLSPRDQDRANLEPGWVAGRDVDRIPASSPGESQERREFHPEERQGDEVSMCKSMPVLFFYSLFSSFVSLALFSFFRFCALPFFHFPSLRSRRDEESLIAQETVDMQS